MTTLIRVPRPRRRGAIPRLPRPGGLQGLARRPIPIDSLSRALKKRIAETVRRFETRAMVKLERSGLLADVARLGEDRDEKAKILRLEAPPQLKAPVGQTGAPLGPERARRIQPALDTKEVKAVGRLFGKEADDWRIELETVLREDYVKLYNAGGRGARLKLKVSGSFQVRNPFILDSLAERANLVSGISDTVFDRMLTVVAEEGVVLGRSPLEIAKSLESEFDFLSRGRAELIARTETLSITEQASHTLYEASGVLFERWLATLDGRERPTHFEAHGQIKEVDGVFIVGNSELRYVGDPEGEPEEIIGCRCTSIPIISEGQIFSDASVWDGANAPDEFARERLAEEAA